MPGERCRDHGLWIGDDGCPRCPRIVAGKPRRLAPALLAGTLVLAVVGMAVVRAVSAVHDLAERPPSPSLAPVVDAPLAAPTAIVATAAAPAVGEAPAAKLEADEKMVRVTLYSATYCGWCRKAKAHLDARGIAYDERIIDMDPEAKREMHRLGGNGVPTFDIDGEIHSGYAPAWVEQTVRRRARRRL